MRLTSNVKNASFVSWAVLHGKTAQTSLDIREVEAAFYLEEKNDWMYRVVFLALASCSSRVTDMQATSGEGFQFLLLMRSCVVTVP